MAAVRRALLINLDFRDFVYSYLWGRAVLDGCARRQLAVDVVTVHPSAGRHLAAELGVAPNAVEPRLDGSVAYLEQPDEAGSRRAVGQLLERHRYDTVIVNCEAPLFLHLLLERGAELGAARWLVYDRHLHVELCPHERDAELRRRMSAARLDVFTLAEIAAGRPDQPAAPPAWRRWLDTLRRAPPAMTPRGEDTMILRAFRRLLPAQRIHLQPWPMDDAFFAPQADVGRGDRFVVFTGGDSGRDYATLCAAVDGLPLELRICAARPPERLPSNATLLPRLALHQFRDEVARAAVVAVPLTGAPPVSGITVIAMARMLARPVIATDSPVVRMHVPRADAGAYLVPRGDAPALRTQLCRLLEAPAESEQLARRAHAQAAATLSLRAFVERMLESA